MNHIIRPIKKSEYVLLNDFLYEAIFIPEGVQAPPKSIINEPALQVYVSGFGKEQFELAYVTPEQAIIINRRADHGSKAGNSVFEGMIERESRVLEMLVEEKYF